MDLSPQALDRKWGEGLADEAAQAGVVGWIAEQEEQLEEVRQWSLAEVGLRAGAEVASGKAGIVDNSAGVGVSGDDPEAARLMQEWPCLEEPRVGCVRVDRQGGGKWIRRDVGEDWHGSHPLCGGRCAIRVKPKE